MMKKLQQLLLLLLTAALLLSCASYKFRNNYRTANSLLHDKRMLNTAALQHRQAFLKAHLKNGHICIYRDQWTLDTISNLVTGTGTEYDFNRNFVRDGALQISLDSVAIFETNLLGTDPSQDKMTALTVMTVLNLVGTVICLTNPKACFGSCPTFYLNENDNFHFADAEGFSDVISPSMAYADMDALREIPAHGGPFFITMKNEALETHVVDEITLLACPRKKEESVFQTPDNRFFLCHNTIPVLQVKADEGDITNLLADPDRAERFSQADPKQLNTKEEIYLTFTDAPVNQELGFVIHFRQSLMTTYFIYSAMGYMGDQVGDVFARLETRPGERRKVKDGLLKELGNLDVYYWNEEKSEWMPAGGFYETGPIAINRQMLPLPVVAQKGEIRLKLVLNKGLWRIDYTALTQIRQQVSPRILVPVAAWNQDCPDPDALTKINTPGESLISLPGSKYKFEFKLPEGGEGYSLFLNAKGYYLEWMRGHWLQDKNLLKLYQMFHHPKQYLREAAKEYKTYETTMEEEFWNSKIETQALFDENN